LTDILLITGPTAVGKTEVAALVAERLGGEVISADSRQVYRHFDIGTAKPEREVLERVPHHLIDIRDAGRDYSAGQFARDALRIVHSLEEQGKVPIVCGGATLYLRALTRGLFREPEDTWALRKTRRELKEEAKRDGILVLHRELMRVDPVTASSLAPGDTQRIIRALEVFRATGVPLSEWHRTGLEKPPVNSLCFCLFLSRDQLARRIERRTRAMIEQGLVGEVRRLLEMGFDEESALFTSVGYREIVLHLRGSLSLEESERLINTSTKNYAKRQMTWFRGMQELTWIENNGEAVDGICEAWKSRSREKE
jgi:tRNA dimethylallyltransferase